MTNPERIRLATEARQRYSQQQRAKARETFEAMVAEGLHSQVRGITVAGVAARAGVSRDLLYAMPELVAEIQTLRDQRPHEPVAARSARDESMKVKLVHAAKEITALQKEQARLQRALARALDGTSGNTADDVEHLHQETARLRADLVSSQSKAGRLQAQLDELQEEHAATRERNRELMKENLTLRSAT